MAQSLRGRLGMRLKNEFSESSSVPYPFQGGGVTSGGSTTGSDTSTLEGRMSSPRFAAYQSYVFSSASYSSTLRPMSSSVRPTAGGKCATAVGAAVKGQLFESEVSQG